MIKRGKKNSMGYEIVIPEADVYYYECTLCKKEVRTTTINKCIVCYKKVCEDCFKEEFCAEHYNMISAEGISILNQSTTDKNEKKKKLNRWETFLLVIFHVFILIFFVLYFSILMFWYILLFIPYIFILIILIQPFENRKERLEDDLRIEKLSLFNKYHKKKDAISNAFEKKCEKCGRMLKSDSQYCDLCGYKL